MSILSKSAVAAATLLLASFTTANAQEHVWKHGILEAKADSGMDAAIKADPRIGIARQGALPILVGGDLIGAMSVSGAPGGDKDEVCTKAGLDKISARLK